MAQRLSKGVANAGTSGAVVRYQIDHCAYDQSVMRGANVKDGGEIRNNGDVIDADHGRMDAQAGYR